MAQLTDDCFAFSGPLLPVGDLERIIGERVSPVAETETIPLAKARGRTLAKDIAAPINLPPFDNSAVDGYAVRHADLDPQSDTRLAIAERITAGRAAAQPLAPGQAIRIFTGAPMPKNADTVFMQEDVQTEDGVVIVPPGLKRGANRRLAGEDVRLGSVVLPAGRILSFADIALASAMGLTELTVRRRIRVALFSTGDELVEPGTPLRTATLYDANRALLAGLINSLGAETTDLGILPDDPAQLGDALKAAADGHDLVLTSGGVSTGEADHVRNAVEAVGKLVFWRVAIKPGRPVAMGVISGKRADANAAFVGLPGNPVAAFITFVRVVRPLIMRLSGAVTAPLVALPVRAAFPYRKKKGRREYVRVALTRADDGVIEASKYKQDGAGVITSLTETDGLVELGEDTTDIAQGDIVGFLPYAVLTG
ncbi:gephyrin-like molybdotransferase Glp [Pseudorhodoplanes sinuspersici]|uniref:Molybdopterin molybdenumtransferase n=1 Tax=Pseudorhodoplanes sinuspersici TaxID=1235591 RepID=A0A1W6ZN29_9HYPH|nr:gephyrin-like molybdotransferase Glp [Pseudorhodoplanes sinuspersici]ARP98771.1 molybdopterin molybdenumtransferase MoeA [Pseudorhodoplanes sinuspersici]RKE69614.1 molybdopterin molybdochelatase [Pseudorhodoplanes sinuspersici]